MTIEDTWDVVGMRGTGSHHVTVDHLEVDPEHCCVFVGEAWPDAPLWRMPVFSIILPMLAAVPLGIAAERWTRSPARCRRADPA